ncbi:glucoamylase family protein [Steroidobacter agaridevorans]|uniref:glucoamylase family protein n=1 Tax=Steroidobacter agaridevorans TaxID=2695856 RepID=UPI001379745E|nr:glucoamylase family protein [Steroidobacter agaridevorans]
MRLHDSFTWPRLLWLLAAALFVGVAGAAEPKARSKVPGVVVERSRVFDPERDGDPVINNLQRRTFRFFWDTTNKQNGLAPDRFPSPSFASTAAVGFALTAYVIGAERGFVSRSQARLRTLRTLRFLESMPQGPDETGMGGYKGFFYHFVHMHNGQRFGTSELSTVDTALLLGGVLLSQSYFDQDSRSEREIRELAEKIYSRVDWQWAQNRPPILSHGWRPESGFLRFDWRGYNEGMLMYILALGSPTHPIEPEAWTEWMRTYKDTYGKFSGQEFLSFGPHFGHQYSHVWIDFRGIMDAWNREKGYDYFENSRRASYAQREYARQNPMRWRGYDSEIWGLTACDGPADTVQIYNNEERGFFTYAARSTASIHILDDGTIAPTASVASIAFAPEIAIPAIRAFRARFGEHLYQKYGFLDSVNPSFTFTDVPLRHGRIVEGIGWIADDYLGIDQGPIVAMIENYRSGLIWSVMQNNPHIRRGLQRAGFTGGWLDKPAPSQPSS